MPNRYAESPQYEKRYIGVQPASLRYAIVAEQLLDACNRSTTTDSMRERHDPGSCMGQYLADFLEDEEFDMDKGKLAQALFEGAVRRLRVVHPQGFFTTTLVEDVGDVLNGLGHPELCAKLYKRSGRRLLMEGAIVSRRELTKRLLTGKQSRNKDVRSRAEDAIDEKLFLKKELDTAMLTGAVRDRLEARELGIKTVLTYRRLFGEAMES